LYLTAISILHRPQMLHPITGPILDAELRELSQRKVHEAADDITTLYKDLYTRGLVRFLPNTGVTCLLPATIVHFLDMKLGNNNVNQLSNRKFKFCMSALEQLGQMYASAGFAFNFFNAAATRLKKAKQTDLEGHSQSWSSNRHHHHHMTLADDEHQVQVTSSSPQSMSTQFFAPNIVPDTIGTRHQLSPGGNFDWDSSSTSKAHDAWGGVLTNSVEHAGQRISKGFVEWAEMERTETDAVMDLNSFIDLDGCEGFFTMTDGVRMGWD